MSQRDPILERSLPSSPDTERAVLGAIILDNSLIGQAITLLKPGDFYVPSHRRVFTAMVKLFEYGTEINPILIAEELRKENELDQCGGVLFLTSLTNGLPHVTSIARFAEIICGKSLLRQLVKVAHKITAEGLEEEDEPQNILDHAEQEIFKLRSATRTEGRSVVSIKQVIEKGVAHLDKLHRSVENPAIETPWHQLNFACRGGINQTELWGLVAPQKMGKSSLAKQLAVHAARRNKRVLIFSREMSDLKIFYRMLSPITDIPVSQIRYGLDIGRIERTLDAMKQLADLGIFFDTHTSDIDDVRIKTREMIRLEGITLTIGDYANQFSASKVRKSGNRSDVVAAVWRGWKDIDQEFEIGSLLLAHPTSDYQKQQPSKKPDERQAPYFDQTHESREAGKAVDVGLVLWTELAKGEPGARPATLYIDYQRDEEGGGKVPLIFNGRVMEFYEPGMEPHDARGFDWNV